MARARKLDTNVPGNFYVNDQCINCDTCRQLAPDTFAEVGDYSAVVQQPVNEAERRQANHALLACPTAAIVSESKEGLPVAMGDFPLNIHENVYYVGYTSPKSYGGSSYLVVHPDGNWLVDAPRFVPQLATKLEKMGGIRYIFLTHRDDVADADKYASHFSAERIIHVLEKNAQPDAEHLIEGDDAIDWQPDFRFIPVPGHTKGHMALLYRQAYLFSGDHLAWDRETDSLTAFEDYCWYSWEKQLQSLGRLLNERFEWVLPGHGDRIHLKEARMRAEMKAMLSRFTKLP